MLRKILLVFLIVIIVIQFIRPTRNLSGDTSGDISAAFNVPENVKPILERACNDCHSNKTRYPWYAEVQPVAWWLNNHIVDGKRHLNYNNFTAMRPAQQKKKMDESIDLIKKNEMPLNSYTWIHKDAILDEADKQTLIAWCNTIIDS